MRKWFKNILGVLILAFLLRYLYLHWDQLKVLLELDLGQIVILYVLVTLETVNVARMLECLIGRFGCRISIFQMCILQCAVMLLNYIPMKFGTVFQAHYLKKFHGLSYTGSAAIFVYRMFMTAVVTGFVGMAALVAGFGLDTRQAQFVGLVFLGLFVGSLVLFVIPIRIPVSDSKWISRLKTFLSHKELLAGQRKTTLICVAHLVAGFLFTASRFLILFRFMGYSPAFIDCLLLGAIGSGAVLLGLTPGGLGMRELLLSAVTPLLGIPMEVGILAAMLDRAVMFSWELVLGGAATIRLWRKDPEDFKQTEGQSRQSIVELG